MVAYEFYRRDEVKGNKLIGILPERRKNPERITQASVMNWGNKVFGNILKSSEMFFVQILIDNDTGQINENHPYFLARNNKK